MAITMANSMSRVIDAVWAEASLRMGQSTKENGRQGYSMDKEEESVLKVMSLKANGRMA